MARLKKSLKISKKGIVTPALFPVREKSTKLFLAFNKQGIGGNPVIADNKKEALKQARDIFGKGATVEFNKKTRVTIIRNQ